MAGGSCAHNKSLEADAWALANFGGATLGNQSRSRRLVALAQVMVENPGMSLPKLLPDWSDLTGAYRLLSNPKVEARGILSPHVALTKREACMHPVVLCVQDSTYLDFTLRTGIKGLGITGDGKGRGLLQHSALAVLPDKHGGGRVLGVLDIAWHALLAAPQGETRLESQSRWSVPFVWHEAAEHIGQWDANSQLIHVGDRHSDLFRFMHEALKLGHGFVVRAMHDRYVDKTADETSDPPPETLERLWEKLERQGVLGQMTVELGTQRDKGNRVKRAGREAVLTIRVSPIVVAPPCKDPRTKDARPLSVYAVYLLEESPPEGTEAVAWMLITSLPVVTLEDARRIAGYYTCRWVIEEWHRCLKEGCRIEDSQLDDGDDIRRLSAILSVVAIRLLRVRDLSVVSPEHDTPQVLATWVPSMFITIVASLAKVEASKLTPRQFHLTVAKRGGYLARKNDPRPGWKVLWRGWNDIVQMVRGAELYREMINNEKKCV
ncbi:MAG: IS4 family transposase [Phycisphaerales bacterium]|nr:IS4 family transposase [Phycisphaerales bacterium]